MVRRRAHLRRVLAGSSEARAAHGLNTSKARYRGGGQYAALTDRGPPATLLADECSEGVEGGWVGGPQPGGRILQVVDEPAVAVLLLVNVQVPNHAQPQVVAHQRSEQA